MSVYKPQYKPYDEVLKSAQRRVPTLPEDFYERIPREMRNLAFTISSIERVTQIQDILASLDRSFEENQSFDEWKESVNVDDFDKLADNRKELVFRMHSQTAYNLGVRYVSTENKDILPWLKYQAILDARTRPNHAANDGITRPVDDPFWETNTPPLGFNCRCQLLNVPKYLTDEEKLTPPAKLKNPDLKPDKGWRYNKLKPEAKLDRYLQKKIETLPPRLKSSMNEYVKKRGLDNDVWWEKNKHLFERQ